MLFVGNFIHYEFLCSFLGGGGGGSAAEGGGEKGTFSAGKPAAGQTPDGGIRGGGGLFGGYSRGPCSGPRGGAFRRGMVSKYSLGDMPVSLRNTLAK